LDNAVNPGGVVQATPTYYLSFPHEASIPSSLTYSVPKADLTAVHQDFYDNASGTCRGAKRGVKRAAFWLVYEPWGGVVSRGDYQVPPGPHTDYWYSNAPGLQKVQNAYDTPNDCTTRYDGVIRTIHPGEEIHEVWNKAPLVPSPAAPMLESLYVESPGDVPGDALQTVCAACRQDDNGIVNINPLSDSDPSHYTSFLPNLIPAPGEASFSSLRFSRNGVLAITSDAPAPRPLGGVFPTGLDLPLLPQAATYQLDWTLHVPMDLIATDETSWTFKSGPTNAVAALPKSEKCLPDFSRACSFLPLLFVNYDLALNYQSRAKASGPFQIAFAVEHQQNAPAPSGVAATVSVSYDDGRTWTDPQAATAQPGGTLATTITHPALADTTGFVSLRIDAHDGEGNAVQQTIIRAYGLTD